MSYLPRLSGRERVKALGKILFLTRAFLKNSRDAMNHVSTKLWFIELTDRDLTVRVKKSISDPFVQQLLRQSQSLLFECLHPTQTGQIDALECFRPTE